MDIFVMGSIVLSFAVLVTVHVALVAGLVIREPRSRGFVALVVPPLAPYWGALAGMRLRAALWILASVVYVVARVAAHRLTAR